MLKLVILHLPVFYLSELIREAKANNQKVYLIITPIIDKLYKDLMLDEHIIFREIYALKENYDNVQILNYYNNDNFNETDFYDWQHLNYHGAIKLTKLIKDEIKHDTF